MAGLLEVRGLSKAFAQGGRPVAVLDQLSLDLAAGQRLTLTGRSGSGKSTLLNLLAGLDEPDAGSVHWHFGSRSEDLFALSEAARTELRRRYMGFVFQFFNLVPTLTALENVALMAELNGMPDALERARARLQDLELGPRLDAFPETLSGGEQQRVAIARALVHEPRVILADEPTGNLDQATGQAVFSQLCDVVAQQGTALVLVTHDAALVEGSDLHLDLSARATGIVQAAPVVP